tara:strand:- start:692 stop:892 length:201 start_codon:yes stop_codon:yes gene_type:complete
MAKVGNKIVTLGNVCHPFFNEGDKAVLTRQDPDGDWWADFTGNEKYYKGGIWCVGPVGEDFELDNS